MRTRRPIFALTVMFVVFAATYVSAQPAAPSPLIKGLAGKWAGLASPTRGTNVPLQVEIGPNGSYTSKWGSPTGKGTVMMEGGKLVAVGQLATGPGTAAAGTGKSQLTLTTKDGKQVLSGAGRDQDGPYDFQLTKQ